MRRLAYNLLGAVTIGLLLESCSPQKRISTQNPPMLVVRKMVYADGWKSCGSIQVSSNGYYVWRVVNIWSPGAPEQEWYGRLPPKLTGQLAEEAAKLANGGTKGCPTLEYFVDDSRHTVPQAVAALVGIAASNRLSEVQSGTAIRTNR